MDKQIAKNEGAMVDLLNQEMKELQGSQKQIEEFACDLYNAWCGDIVIGDKYKWVAKKLMALGYRKIPEGAVVLTREEYQTLKLLAQDKCHYDCPLIDYPDFESERMVRETTREETAEKFSERLKKKISSIIIELKANWATKEVEGFAKDVHELTCNCILNTLNTVKDITIDEIAKEITEGEV